MIIRNFTSDILKNDFKMSVFCVMIEKIAYCSMFEILKMIMQIAIFHNNTGGS